jgi:selenocysteine lyase/cysteine desulfurase
VLRTDRRRHGNVVAAIAKRAHETGTFVAVYNAHAAPHVPVDRDTIGADVLTCSAYRFFGPRKSA